MSRKRKKKKKELAATGVDEIDSLAQLERCTLADYIKAASAYVHKHGTLADGPKKAAQIRLSNALSRALADELEQRLPYLRGRLATEEQDIAGGLRKARADLSESHELDGLRLAVELKPVNLAVGRAIWNRFGDIRAFAVNVHLKFPFAVVGGVLAIPTYEEKGTAAAKKAEKEETAEAEDSDAEDVDLDDPELEDDNIDVLHSQTVRRKSTIPLIDRAVERLVRAGGRKSEAEAAHLLEGIAVVVYDPDKAVIDPTVPQPGTGLRWEEFVESIIKSYRARFEE